MIHIYKGTDFVGKFSYPLSKWLWEFAAGVQDGALSGLFPGNHLITVILED